MLLSSPLVTYSLFALGFYVLIKGADYLVDGSSSLAKKLKIPPIVIGLTIVAFGTSMPELIVNIMASISGSSDLAIGNVVGSNIFNLLFILGIAAVIYPLSVLGPTIWKEIPFSLLAAVVLFILANDKLLGEGTVNFLSKADGIILLLFFAIFLYYIIYLAKSGGGTFEKIKEYPLGISLLMIGGGLAALIFGGRWVVDGAILVAKTLGVSEALIGLTIVAIGTSLPELVTSAMAAYKKNSDIAVGNIIGSNIFNVFWILGLGAVINPTKFSPMLNFDIEYLMLVTILLFIFMFIGKRHILERWQGISFIGLYVMYTVYLILRG